MEKLTSTKLKSSIKRILILLGIVYCGLAALIFFFQDAMVFIPTKGSPKNNPAIINLEYEDLLLDSDDHKINAWFVPHHSPKGTVFFAHGNAGNLGHRLTTVQLWNELGYNIMLYDYSGFGKSGGTASELNIYKNADAVYNWLIQKGISQDSIIAHGRSLGGASAAYIATTKKLKGLILESTFTSIPDMASYRFPWLPTSILCTTKLDTGERVKSYQGKTLVLHSPDDQVIPFQMGKELAETTSTELVLLKGGHNDVFLQRQRYKLALEKFLNSL
ncbi:MAG: alpha/beta hydrolase [Lentisphaeraceae bacterium]|nr:alpha/beta hydrolase [Lentisphaeraceae bacterium]